MPQNTSPIVGDRLNTLEREFAALQATVQAAKESTVALESAVGELTKSMNKLVAIFEGSKMIAAIIKWTIGVVSGLAALAAVVHFGGKQ